MPMHLRAARGQDVGALYALVRGPNGLGRSRANVIVLKDDKASAEHARIDVDAAGAIFTDLDSTNGSLLNDSPAVRPMRLRPGDAIQIGNTVLVYEEGESSTGKQTTRVQIVVEEDDTRSMMPVAWTPQGTTEMLPLISAELKGDELRELYGLLSTLYRVTALVSRCGTLDELLAGVLEVVFDILPAERGSVLFLDGPDDTLVPRAGHCRDDQDPTIRVSRTIVRDVVKSGRGVLTRDALEDARFRAGESIVLYGIRSAMCVPVGTGRKLFGVVYLDTSSPSQQFTARDLELLTAVGAEMALAIENFQLFERNLQAERLAAIGEAIAGLSHYIKNILQSLDAARYLVHAAVEEGDREGLAEAWDALDHNTGLISELVLNMLSYSRRAAPAYESCQPNLLATQLVEMVAARAKEQGVRFRIELDEAMPEASLDRGAVHRALLNLLTNAIDVSGEGRVTVATRWDSEGERVQFRITDSGPGIPEEDREAIFEAFYTTKGSRGTGLGLAVTRKLVEDMGGTVEVESAVGEGAAFIITLPIRPDAGEGEAP